MTFNEHYQNLDLNFLNSLINNEDSNRVEKVLQKETLGFNDLLILLSPAAEKQLKGMAIKAQGLTKRYFGKTLQFYVPLYLANHCENECLYCGFNKDSKIKRKKLTLKEIKQELELLKDRGFQHLLLLTGEDHSEENVSYVEEAIKLARNYFPAVSLEIFSAQPEDYQSFVEAGATGLTIYQETYQQNIYAAVHGQGPKKDFQRRLAIPELALKAGIRRIGLGALLGLADWRLDIAMLGAHAEYLTRKYWRSEVAISFPRLRDFAEKLDKLYKVTDINLVQMITALRIFLPWIGLVLSTREPAELRDRLLGLGITQMSAESRTNPGGYHNNNSGEQFSVADKRSLAEIIEVVREKGYDPVLKDWAYEFSPK